MATGVLVVLLVLFYTTTRSYCDCTFEPLSRTIRCSNTDQDSLAHHVVKVQQKWNGAADRLEIELSDLLQCDDLLLTDEETYKALRISHSFVDTIEEHFLEPFIALEELVLSNNNIYSISFLKGLRSNLTKLRLDNNKLEDIDAIYSERVKFVRELDLSLNSIKNIKVVYFPNLQHVILNRNKIADIGNVITGKMNQLLTLDLGYNDLKYVKDDDFKLLPALQTLKINNCKVAFLASSAFSMLHHLKLLNVSNNYLRRIDNVYFISNLLHFDISGNNLQKFSFSQQTSTFSVFNLNLSHNNLSEVSFNSVNVSNLDISHNNFLKLGKQTNMILRSLNSDQNFVNKKSRLITKTDLNVSSYIGNNALAELKTLRVLDLRNNDIITLEPNAFLGLTNLKFLQLAFNNITEINELTFAGLQNLTYLNLSYSNLMKINTNTFSVLKSIEIVDLSGNGVLRIPDRLFYGLPFLKTVYMPFTTLRILENRTFSDLLRLKDLKLHASQIAVVGYKSFSNLKALKYLDLSELGIKVLKPVAFYKCASLEIIDLRRNKLSHLEAKTFFGLHSLSTLQLSGNFIKFIERNAFSTLVAIQYVDISFDGMLQTNTFRGLENLSVLNITFSEIGIEGGAFTTLPNLVSLFINSSVLVNNNITAKTKSDACMNSILLLESNFFLGLNGVIELNLTNVCLKSIKPEAFKGLDSLLKLHLSHNKLTAIGLNTFEGLHNLSYLDLSHNFINSLHNMSFQGLSQLKEVKLSFNNLSLLPDGLLQQTLYLRSISFQYNNITELTTETFVNLTQVSYINLSFNNITKLKEIVLFPLKNLEHLDISGNHITTINYTLITGIFPNLRFVDVCNNRWRCDILKQMLLTFRKLNIGYKSENPPGSGVDGIACTDECSYFYCERGNF